MDEDNTGQVSKQLNKVEDICVRDAPPQCVTGCPAQVDARGIAQAVKNGDFAGAYKVFAASIPFTRIISETCSRPCEGACKMAEQGDGVQIGSLEKASVAYGYKKSVLNKAFLPKKSEKTAVIGGGLNGLTAAYYLRRKGYGVDIYEKTGKLGGRLNHIVLEEIIQSETAILAELGVNVIYNREITRLSEIENEYQAIYVSVYIPKLNLEPDHKTLYVKDNIFAGVRGRHPEYSSILSLSEGKRAATSIERYFQNVSMTFGRELEELYNFTTEASKGTSFTKDEALKEAARCDECRCDECIKGCSFFQHYKTDPKKFIREVRNCLAISVGNRFANESINSCLECGFCAAVCPVGLDTGRVCAEARTKMVETGKMPPSAHDFALKDMAHSNGEDYFLAKHQPGFDKSRYVFFPGCQLGATAPEIVETSYTHLQENLNEGVALILGCCGAIAQWAARKELFHGALAMLKDTLNHMGNPEIITACPTCYKVFTENMPELQIKGIWDILETTGLPDIERKPMTLAAHDACTTRENSQIHGTVRKLLALMNIETTEPNYTKELTQCCGYGGLTGFVNPALSNEAAKLRISQSEDDYVVYCINCRDRLMANGRKAYHLLELVYGGYNSEIKSFGWSERRQNREGLKRRLLNRFWGEDMEEKEDINIILEHEVKELIENRMILLSDIKGVIKAAESTGKKLMHKETGAYVAAGKSGSVTFWVWYTGGNGEDYRVCKAYSHRMSIEGM